MLEVAEGRQKVGTTPIDLRGPGGRKRDFPDAERLVKRLVAEELTLSLVPDAEQRLWRSVMRRKYQVTRNRVQLLNRLEALLEEAHIKVSNLVSDLLGISARRMLPAVAEGETDPPQWRRSRPRAFVPHSFSPAYSWIAGADFSVASDHFGTL